MKKAKKVFLLAALCASLGQAWAADPGVMADKIILGTTCVLSGPQAENGHGQLLGMRVYWATVNEAGGVHGKKVEVKELDDAYDGKKAAANAAVLADETFVLTGLTGTGAALAVLPVLAEKKIPMVGAITGMVPKLRDGSSKWAFNVRASYAGESNFLVAMLKSFGQKKMMIVAEDNPFGKIGIDELSKAAKAQGGVEVETLTVKKDGETEAVAVITKKGDELPVVLVLAGTAPKFLAEMKKANARNRKYALSPIGEINVSAKDSADGLIVSQVVPPYSDTSIPLVREYRAAMAKHAPKNKLTPAGLEGFLTAKIVRSALENSGAAPTRENFVKAMESMKWKDFGGISVNYGEKEKNGSAFVDVILVNKGKFVY